MNARAPEFNLSRFGILTLVVAAWLSTIAPVAANTCSYLGMLGGSGRDTVVAVLVDPQGNLYLAGSTTSVDFPVANAVQKEAAGGSDLFVAKLDVSGCNLIFATYLGGSRDDFANALALDASGNLWIAGTTASPDFPVVVPTYDPRCGTDGLCNGGATDAFLVALDPGGALVAGTFFGGGGNDEAGGLALDAAGRVALAGTTRSSDLPLLLPTQRGLRGAADGLVARFDSSSAPQANGRLSLRLSFSTFYGGSGIERVTGATFTSKNALVVVGTTRSRDLPQLSSPRKSGLGGISDAFVSAWSGSEPKLTLSMYLGGSGTDEALAVAALGTDVVVSGETWSADFPLIAPLQNARRGASDAFLTRIDPSRPGVVFSTLFGGSEADSGRGVAVDSLGDILLVGSTASVDLPLTANAEQKGFGGGDTDTFVARIPGNGQSLAYSTYLGGSLPDRAASCAPALDGGWVVAGALDLPDVPGGVGNRDAYYALLGPPIKSRE